MKEKLYLWMQRNPYLTITAAYVLALLLVALLSIPVNYFFGGK